MTDHLEFIQVFRTINKFLNMIYFNEPMLQKNDSINRIGGTMASSIFLMMQGIQILRIHDVNEVIQGIKVFSELIKN